MNFLEKNRSLARQQWLGLSALTLLALMLVSSVVYVMTARHLDTRRQDALIAMSHLVNHLVRTTPYPGEHHLAQRLDEHFSGHADLALSLRDTAGILIYQTARPPAVDAATLDFVSPLAANGQVLRAQLAVDTLPDRQLLQHLAGTLIFSALAGAGLIACGGWWLIRRGLAPVAHLVAQVGRLQVATLGQRLDGSVQPDELHPLVVQINAMLDRIDAAYQQLDGFNADVAHELNTPLTTLMTSTELALRKERNADVLRELLASNLEELQRMSGIIKDMLFLAQVDRGALARRTPTPSLRTLALSLIDYHEALCAEAGVFASVKGDACGAFDLPLIKRALSNLLSNAIRHAQTGSTITIHLAQTSADEVRLGVSNQGADLPAAQLPRIFDRFYRIDPARAQPEFAPQTHHGLGLSIVAAVARMHGGEPFATSNAGETHIGFTLRCT